MSVRLTDADLDRLVAAWTADLDGGRRAGGCARPPDDAALARLAAGTADPAEAALLRAHLADCVSCLNAYAGLLAVGVEAPAAPWEDAPFVGRRRELAALLAGLDRVMAGSAAFTVVTGPAGMGKSRLLTEARRTALARGARVIRTRCSPAGASRPYRPLVELLQGLCRFDDLDPDDTVRGQLEAAIRAAGLNADGALPFLARLTRPSAERQGPVAEPTVLKDKVAEILGALVARASQDHPLVLELEDLQWCDTASAECLGRLAPRLAAARVHVIGSRRPGRAAGWLEAAGATTLALPPLIPLEARELLARRAAPGLPEGLREDLIARAAGNPLLLEELALATHAGDAQDVPASAGDGGPLVRRRLAALDDNALSLARLAAVVGVGGPLALLRAASAELRIAFEPALGRLEEDGILLVVAAPGAPGFRFRHALIQETAYGDLAAEERPRWHGAVARAMEAQGGEGAVEALAYHFGRSDDDDRAVDCALRAAGEMVRRAASAEALVVLDAARQRLARMPATPANELRRIDVVLNQAEARFGLGQHGEQIEALRGIEALVERAGDPRRLASWHYWRGFLHILTGGRPAPAIEHCRAASAVADAAGIEDVYAFSESCLSQVLAMAGDLRGALDAGKRALAIFESGRDAWWSCRTLWHLASAALALGQWSESVAFCERAREHGRSVSDSRLMAVAWLRLGAAHVHRGDWETGVHCCDRAEQLAHTAFDAAMLRVNRGYGWVRGGRLAEGAASIAEGLAWFRRAGLRYSELLVSLRLGEAQLRAGDRTAALDLARETLDGARHLGYRHVEGMALALLGEALAEGEPAAAARTLEAAADVLEEVGALNDLARVKAAQGILAERGGDRAGSLGLFRSALRLFEALGTLDEAARVRAVLAAMADRPGR